MRFLAFIVLLMTLIAISLSYADQGKPAQPEPLGAPRDVEQDPPDLTGYYEASGSDENGTYNAVVLIYRPIERVAKKRYDIYVVQWFNSGKIVAGVAPVEKSRLVAGFGFKNPKGINEVGSGTVSYHVESDGKGHYKLTGKWLTLPGNGKLGDEMLTWLKDYKYPE